MPFVVFVQTNGVIVQPVFTFLIDLLSRNATAVSNNVDGVVAWFLFRS